MAKYTIIYTSGPNGESNDSVLTLVNQLPDPLPMGAWTQYKHDSKTVLEITTLDATAAIIITPAPGNSLPDQSVKAKLGVGAAEPTSHEWSSATGGLQLDMSGTATSTTFDINDSYLPPQALRVTVKRPS